MDHSTNKVAAQATLHCLTGCAIGEVLGMILAAALNWTTFFSVFASIILAFLFGYGLSIRPLLRHGLGLKESLRVALAADTASITVMELSDNAFILLVPGAINAGLNTGLFWVSLALSLVVAFIFAFPVNKYLISRGKGHALAHQHHH